MRRASFLLFVLCLLAAACGEAYCYKVYGEVTRVVDDTITAVFPAKIRQGALMIIRTGKGESVAGTAIAVKCGSEIPCEVEAKLHFVADAPEIVAGKEVFLDSMNVTGLPASEKPATGFTASPPISAGPGGRDLNFYYYAAGQKVGYGAVGMGYERTIRISQSLGLQIDGGVATIGSVSSDGSGSVETEQLIKSLNGRLKFDFTPGFGVYSAYRWNEGRGDDERWNSLADSLQGKTLTGSSCADDGTVLTRGIEYGLSLRPNSQFSISLGYIPKYRTDFGSMGILTEAAFTGELRFGGGKSAIRLRGISSETYWQADLGIAIR